MSGSKNGKWRLKYCINDVKKKPREWPDLEVAKHNIRIKASAVHAMYRGGVAVTMKFKFPVGIVLS